MNGKYDSSELIFTILTYMLMLKIRWLTIIMTSIISELKVEVELDGFQ